MESSFAILVLENSFSVKFRIPAHELFLFRFFAVKKNENIRLNIITY